MTKLTQDGFSPEGGKLYLAEALFSQWRFNIRCPHCIGNAGQPGFIRDQGGKAPTDGLKRRQWACQRSNGRGIGKKCPRAACSAYISLAQTQLNTDAFAETLRGVCMKYDPSMDEHMALQAYLAGDVHPKPVNDSQAPQGSSDTASSNPRMPDTSDVSNCPSSDTSIETTSMPRTLPAQNQTPAARKRPANAELPSTPSPMRRRRNGILQTTELLRIGLEHLSPLLELGKEWKRAYDHLIESDRFNFAVKKEEDPLPLPSSSATMVVPSSSPLIRGLHTVGSSPIAKRVRREQTPFYPGGVSSKPPGQRRKRQQAVYGHGRVRTTQPLNHFFELQRSDSR